MTPSDFLTAYKKTAQKEGGYASEPGDSGGETWKGIARNANPDWPGWMIVDAYKKMTGFPGNLSGSSELQTDVLKYLKANYWDALLLTSLDDQRMAQEVYDTAVNMGVHTAGIFLQRVINIASTILLSVDGQVGIKTILAYNTLSANDKYMSWKLFNCLQGERYIGICEANPAQKKFIRSWSARVFEF